MLQLHYFAPALLSCLYVSHTDASANGQCAILPIGIERVRLSRIE